MAAPRLSIPCLAMLLCITLGCDINGRKAPGLTEKSVRALALGMGEAEVVALLGDPLQVLDEHECKPDGRPDLKVVCKKLFYALPGRDSDLGWDAWVHFKENRLHCVSISNTDLYRTPVDKQIYYCSVLRCPWILDEQELAKLR